LVVVCNSGPLIILSKLGLLELLQKIFGEIHIPNQVVAELSQSLYSPIQLNKKWITVHKLENDLDLLLKNNLDSGEAEVISLGLELKADKLIIDERKGRKIAETVFHFSVIGTCGILIIAKKYKYISDIKPYLLSMKDNGYYISDEIQNLTLRAANEYLD